MHKCCAVFAPHPRSGNNFRNWTHRGCRSSDSSPIKNKSRNKQNEQKDYNATAHRYFDRIFIISPNGRGHVCAYTAPACVYTNANGENINNNVGANKNNEFCFGQAEPPWTWSQLRSVVFCHTAFPAILNDIWRNHFGFLRWYVLQCNSFCIAEIFPWEAKPRIAKKNSAGRAKCGIRLWILNQIGIFNSQRRHYLLQIVLFHMSFDKRNRLARPFDSTNKNHFTIINWSDHWLSLLRF